MANIPRDTQIQHQVEEMMKTVALETMSTKQFIAALFEKFGGADLRRRKNTPMHLLQRLLIPCEKANASGGEENEDVSSNDELVTPKPRRGGGGLSAVKEISNKLSTFLNCGKHMAQTALVKAMWEYIKENNLQNPNDKRDILLDDRVQAIFGVDRILMFTMNKYIGAHIEPFKPVGLTPRVSDKPKKCKAKGGKEGERTKMGLQAPYKLSDELAAVVGKDVLP